MRGLKRYRADLRSLKNRMIIEAIDVHVFRADDPAIVDALRKADEYDKGDAEWRAQLEAQFRTTIETLKDQCSAYGKENEELKRDSEALRKLERMLANSYYLHIIRFNDGAVAINGCDAGGSKSITDPDNVPDDLLSAIEAAQSGGGK